MDQRLLKTMLDVDEQHWWYRGRRQIIRAELDQLPLPRDAQILDAGCGSGRTLEELADYGTVAGLELNPDAADVARDRGCGEVHVGRLEELPWSSDTFELITCLDVIEHVPDDRAALRELRRVSRPDGWLLATVPAYQALWSYHDEANHHFRRYGRATLRAAVADAGWRLERMTSFNMLLFPPAAVVRLAQRRLRRNGGDPDEQRFDLHLGPSWLNDILERPLRAEANWLRRGHTLPAGLSLLAVLQNVGG
jgi:SAM-dependent methyltransferase